MALSLDGTTGITSDSGTPVIENLNTTATGIDITGQLTTTGNVGIGTSSPDTPLEVKHSASSDAIKISGNADSVAPYLSFENQESGTAYVRGRIRGASNGVDGGLIFQTGSSGSMTERLRILSSGGITFNGDTAAANALDDYEEGTWTPILSTNGLGGTLSSTAGQYIKIGKLVHVWGTIVMTAATTPTSFTYIDNLPFSVLNITYSRQAGGVWHSDDPGSAVSKGTGFVRAGLNLNRMSLYLMSSPPTDDTFIFFASYYADL